jgi:hypothetical protein
MTDLKLNFRLKFKKQTKVLKTKITLDIEDNEADDDLLYLSFNLKQPFDGN